MESMEEINIVCYKILGSYGGLDDFKMDVNKYLYNKSLHKLKSSKKVKLKNEKAFIEAFTNRFADIDISWGNKKINKRIKSIFQKLTITEIIEYDIIDLSFFNDKVKKLIIQRKNFLEEIEVEKILKQCVICEKSNNNDNKIYYYSPEFIEKIYKKYKTDQIDYLFKYYYNNKCKRISLSEYEKITNIEELSKRNSIKIIHKCNLKIFLNLEILKENKIELYCPICKKTYELVYRIPNYLSNNTKLITNEQRESYLYKLGYSTKKGVSEDERRAVLCLANLLGDMHNHEIINFLKYLNRINRNNKNHQIANMKRKEDIEWFIEKFKIKN